MKQISSRVEVLLLRNVFRRYLGLNLLIEHNSARKKFLIACFCWDSRHTLREMGQEFEFCGAIDYGDEHLEFILR